MLAIGSAKSSEAHPYRPQGDLCLIGRYDQSPLPLAPPFRTLHERYSIEDLEESQAEGVVTGHPSIPEFQLDGAQINQLIDYLKTLE